MSVFNQGLDYWWGKEGFFLHSLNVVRIKFILSFTGPCSVLDVGCGGGILTESLARIGFDVTGVEKEVGAFECCLKRREGTGLDISYLNAEFDDVEGTYDIITAMEIVEHTDPSRLFSFAQKALKPRGKFFLSTINRNFASLLLAKIAPEYILGILEKGTHKYKDFVTPDEIKELASSHGFRVLEVKGMRPNIFGEFKICNSKQVNYLVALELI